MANDFGGLKADRLRVKITRGGRPAGRQTSYGGQIGFKRQDGGYDNYWVDLMDASGTLQCQKGDVLFVSGRFAMKQDAYNGEERTKYTIWDAAAVDANTGQPLASQPRQDAPQGNPNQSHDQRAGSSDRMQGRGDYGQNRQGREEGLGPAFPSEASGLDDVPF